MRNSKLPKVHPKNSTCLVSFEAERQTFDGICRIRMNGKMFLEMSVSITMSVLWVCYPWYSVCLDMTWKVEKRFTKYKFLYMLPTSIVLQYDLTKCRRADLKFFSAGGHYFKLYVAKNFCSKGLYSWL